MIFFFLINYHAFFCNEKNTSSEILHFCSGKMLNNQFAFVYTEVSPFVVVALVLLYFVARKFWFAPHVLIFGWLLVGLLILTQWIQKLVMKGWVAWFFKLAKQLLNKTWINVLLGVEKLRNNWLGRVLGILALTNLLLLVVWAYYNVDLLAWIRSTVILLCDCVQAFFDPVAMLRSFDTWKNTVPILGKFLNIGTEYVDHIWATCERGTPEALIIVPAVSAGILCCAIIIYALWNIDQLWSFNAR